MITRQHGVNVVTAALIYNYLANNNYSLEMSKINQYIEAIKVNLNKNQIYDVDLSIRNTNIYLDSFFIMGDMRNDMTASLNLSSNLERLYNEYIKYLPSEILNETLNEEILKIIGVDKENLKICKDENFFVVTKDVYEKDAEVAKTFAINLLKKQGKHKIKVVDCKKDYVDRKQVFHVNLSYVNIREYLNEEMFRECDKVRQKRYTRYTEF